MTGTTSLRTRTGIVSRTALLAWLAIAVLVLIVAAIFSWPSTVSSEQGPSGRITSTMAHVREAPAASAGNVGALTSVREAGAPGHTVGTITDTDVEVREGSR